MYIKIDEELYKEIHDLTNTNYEIEGDMLPIDSIIPMLKDLLYRYKKIEDRNYYLEHPEDRPDYE